MLLCYHYQNGIIDEEEDIIFALEPELFSIGTISLLETIQSMKTINVGIMDIDVKTSISKQDLKYKAERRRYLATYMNQK